MAEHRSFVVGSRIRLSTKKEGAPYLAPSFFFRPLGDYYDRKTYMVIEGIKAMKIQIMTLTKYRSIARMMAANLDSMYFDLSGFLTRYCLI